MEVVKNGVKYVLWTPNKEEKIEEMVKEHAKEIFGEDSEYFDIKSKMRSESGIGSIPDGYLITFVGGPSWHIIEVELSTHDLYTHIVPQITKFIIGMKNPKTRSKILNAMYEEIKGDPKREERFKERIENVEVHQFLSNMFSQDPTLVIIIDSKMKELEEICNILPVESIALEFKTFMKESQEGDEHVHLIEPLHRFISPVYPIPIVEERENVVEVTLGGNRVMISREGIVKASENSEIENYSYREWYVEIGDGRYPPKGLISLATGIPTSEFVSNQARGILAKLGFKVRRIEKES